MSIILIRSQVIYGNLVETHGPYSRHYTTTYLIYKSNISLRFLDFNPISEHLYKKTKKGSGKNKSTPLLWKYLSKILLINSYL